MTKSRIFLILSLSFIGGIFWRSFFSGNISIYYILLAAAISVAVFYRNKYVLVFSLAAFFLVFGFWLTNDKLETINSANLDGKNLALKVSVSKEPQIKENYQNIIVKTENGLKVLLAAGLYQDLNYGDELDLKCTLKIPENKEEDFDYRMYLAKDGVFYLCQGASFEKTGENKGNKTYRAILNLKKRLSDNISSVIPQPEAALANGLIFGGNSQLSEKISDNFSKTGLSHIVAVSGFNVTIIAEYLMLTGIFLGLWRKQAFWSAIVGIFLFVLSVGFPSSAVRAGVMGSLLLWAMKNGRLANSFNAIIFSAAVMLLFNPLLLRWDIGFQLSFLAALGIVEMAPFWEKIVFKKFKSGIIFENILLTLSATIFVLPIIMYNFHTLSVVSLLANALILPIIPLAMLLVFLTSAIGLLSVPISLPFAWVAFLPLKYVIGTVDYISSWKWASITIDSFNVFYLILWYIILSVGIYLLKLKIKISK